MKKVVCHLCKENGWDCDSKQPKQPKILVLGSFNPYNPDDDSPTDFYYSRIPKRGSGNRFWPTIGKLKYNNPKYFRENPERRFEELVESEFMFLDLIKSIEFTSEDGMILNQFLKKKIYKNFSDSNIWTTKTYYESIPITIKRNYNEKVLETLSNLKSIKKVINTLGSVRGNLGFNSREKEWSDFKNQLFQICNSRDDIDLVLQSVSPSQRSRVMIEELEKWMNNHILKK